MATNAMGPTMAGGLQPIVEEGYELIYLPDINNDALQREGKSPVFYWLPNYVHIARKGGAENGDFMFNLIRFAGVENSDTGTGTAAEAPKQVAGGVLTFTATSAPPDRVLQISQDKIKQQWTSNPDHFWGIRTNQVPVFRPAIITSNITSISNISPIGNRGLPAVLRRTRSEGGSERTVIGVRNSTEPPALPRTVRDGPVESNDLDAWYWHMQGQGNGTIDPSGQNAYSALVGAYPAAILWQAFHGTASPVVVIQALKMKVWSPIVELTIRGNWSRVFEHFSAAASGHYLWASADISAEFNNMRVNGTIEVDVKVDQTLPGAEKIAEQIDKRTDLVFNKFMEEANKIIFEPPPPKVEPAQASGGGWGPWGVGVALKYRRDQTNLSLNYHETRQFAYLQEHTISSSLEGMYDAIKADPAAEKKYFLSVDLNDWPQMMRRIVKPVVSWGGQPVAFLSAQVGYPNSNGALQWAGHVFQKTDGDSATWTHGITQKNRPDVANPPAGWEPDRTYVKRKVHLLEEGDSFQDPFVQHQIDQNVIDLDPEPNGTLLNDVTLEVRADSAGKIAVGPLSLGAVLEDARQTVEVTMEPTDDQGRSLGRQPVRFQWLFANQDEPRFWSVFTGDPEFRPFYRYRVKVIVKGSLFQRGQEWEGPWVEASGNGPLTVSVPLPGDPGVSSPREVPIELVSADGRRSRSGPPEGSEPMTAPASRGEPALADASLYGWGSGREVAPAQASASRAPGGDGGDPNIWQPEA